VDLSFIESFYAEFGKTYTVSRRFPSVKASSLDQITDQIRYQIEFETRYHVKQAELDAIRAENKAKPSLPKYFCASTSSSRPMPRTISKATLPVAPSSKNSMDDN
jgi:hypothetical protein